MSNRILKSHSVAETEAEAAGLAQRLNSGVVLALYGELGAGKTAFARGFARGLGIKESVSSPTFTIVQEYSLPNEKWLYHLDLYRISGPEAALSFGIDEYLSDKSAFTLIEWPERISILLPPKTISVKILQDDEFSRTLEINGL
ncbi:MAG: tRNA (adenosine(37)-N6)-threonylcarbamoyltransferase complex ATPase subunit type 1 TsaE [Lentisphaerae bacterium GWF2_52_8]|nr:MAG: tRNA (adenosine(37)-N6)-threonylcarbamoyltransferase complex ATPase subunit type 1 TsaE [Lentisphaerae bacterium GWF2_52_8]